MSALKVTASPFFGGCSLGRKEHLRPGSLVPKLRVRPVCDSLVRNDPLSIKGPEAILDRFSFGVLLIRYCDFPCGKTRQAVFQDFSGVSVAYSSSHSGGVAEDRSLVKVVHR